MVSPTVTLRVACVGAAVQLGMRPIVATIETMFRVAATNRPLVIVVGFEPAVDRSGLRDLAVSVGAQMIEVGLTETPEQLIERIGTATRAARMLRASPRS
jgi:hypothetical protein